METIKTYLDNIFNSLPDTPEIIHLKNNLLADMEAKYYELKNNGKTENEAIGTVISEFGNIDELINEIGISVTQPKMVQQTDSVKPIHPVLTQAEIETYCKKTKTSSYLIALGVGLILFAISLFVFLESLGEQQLILKGFSIDLVEGLPLIPFFLLIACAVGLFIYAGISLEEYKKIDDGNFSLSASTIQWIEQQKKATQPKFTFAMVIGVVLCILSVLPVIIFSFFSDAITSILGVPLLFIIIAVAVALFIIFGMQDDLYKKLLKQKESYNYNNSNETTQYSKPIRIVNAVFWPIITCIYLIWSFWCGNWHISWIIFPIAGILSAAFHGVCKELLRKDN